MHQKSDVLRLFLQFIQKYVPLGEAIVASLGGEGKEARIWQEVGIKPENGWVIERNKMRSKSLIGKLPYRFTTSLASFSRVYRTVKGRNAGLDAFHLDLCGTLEPSVDEIQKIIPLVTRSRGRCLAITVADARRNLSVEQFKHIEARLRLRLGYRYDRLREKLRAEQGEDRELAVIREIGFFYHMLQALKYYGRYSVPMRVKRVAYVSHKTGSGFPMRTYFFHLGKKSSRVKESRMAQILYRLWFREELVNLNKRPVAEIGEVKETATVSKAPSNEYSNLEAVAAAAGGRIQEQFDMLLVKANGKNILSDFFGDLKMLIDQYAPMLDGIEVRGEPAEVKAPAVHRTSGTRNKSRKKASVKTQIPENGQKLEAQLVLIDAYAKSRNAFENTKKKLAKKFKMARKGNKFNILGALYARTQGKHRKVFLAALGKAHPERIDAKLAELYSKIEKREVTPDELRAEAGIA